MTTRRDFLTTLGATLGATVLGGARCMDARDARDATAASTAPTAANAHLQRIGIQLYTLRSLTSKDLEGTLSKVAEIGYREVEFAGYFGRTPAQIRAMLLANRLTSPSVHIPMPASDDGWKKSIDEARLAGHEWAVVPWLDAAARKDWQGTAARFNALAELAKAGGMRFAYHNHDFELAKVGNGTALDVLLANTDPKLVDYEMDIYWVVKGGADPMDLITRHPGRFPLLHVKDAGPAPDRKMADVGAGTIEFAKIFASEKASGMRHAFVEHDSPADPLATATASYKHLAALKY